MSFKSKTSNKRWTRTLTVTAILAVVISILPAVSMALAVSPAVPVLPASTQFDMTGFLKTATLDPSCAGNPHCGGTLTLNGITITVPKETIVILPASALTWQELFTMSPAPYTGTETGMAMDDLPKPLTTYELQVTGNRVGNQYIAGLIHVSQQDLNVGAGYINFMDYTNGTLYVGGTLGTKTGARVQINDPANLHSVSGSGRFGRAMTPDIRFQVDQDNPTVVASTGFPMCFPRTDPAGTTPDKQCPESNRPNDATGVPAMTVQMSDPASLPLGGALDPRVQAPMEVGDYIFYSGTLIADAAGTYVSAHTISDNAAIYTAPGTNPAYVSIEVSILGTGGLTVVGAGEAVIRTRFEGMTTDPSRNIHLYGVDVNFDGTTSDRDWGTIGVDPGPATGAVKGRWRFRPGCLPFGSVPTVKDCVYGQAGLFLPATREVRAVIEGQQTQVTALNAGNTLQTAANGIYYGQYHAPIAEFIFPENVPGAPIVENNFNTIPFLTCGGYSSITGVVAATLNPWPSNVPATCSSTPVLPVANAGAAQTVNSGAVVNLTGSASGNPTPALSWSQTGGPLVTLSSANTATATFKAPTVTVDTVLSFMLKATNTAGSSSATTTVTVKAAASASPTFNAVTPITLASGANGSFTITGTNWTVSPTVVQAGTPALTQTPTPTPPSLTAGSISGCPSACTSIVKFQAPVLPLGTSTNDVVTLTISTAGAQSTSTTVTVQPPVDIVAITASEYRTSKQRLVMTASSNSPTAILTLQPYLTTTGIMYNPAVLGNQFTLAGGIWTLTLVGAPQPAAGTSGGAGLQVKSNLNGLAPITALQTVRQ